MTLKALMAQIKKHKEAIATHRDALRDLIGDVASVVDASDRALDELECAIDALSEYL